MIAFLNFMQWVFAKYDNQDAIAVVEYLKIAITKLFGSQDAE